MSRNKLPSVSDIYRRKLPQVNIPPRILLGAGPSNIHPRIIQAMLAPQTGHLDPHYLDIMDDVQGLLRYVWQTSNEFTIAISGTGSAAMEAAVVNAIEPGDVVVVGVAGYFGERLCTMIARHGGDVRRIDKPWGEVFSIHEIRTALAKHSPAVLALVHAETSTGATQPLEGVGSLCREHNALLLIDSVTSLGGVPLFIDRWGIDVAYSCSQKGLSCPPGVSPLTLSTRALAKLDRRQNPVGSWYLDAELLDRYWGPERVYHHTAPILLTYALREALRLISEEGLAECWQRHRNNAELFWLGLSDMNLECHVAHEHRLPTLTSIRVPDGVNAKAVARYLLEHYNIEVSGGLGELAGKIWRIGLMGFNSRAENVTLLLSALEEAVAHAR